MTPQEKLRKHQRGIEKTIRELEREKKKLEVQQRTVTASIKKSAKDGEWNAVKLQAKDLARTRR
jgi:charged multivesicular body protein 2A